MLFADGESPRGLMPFLQENWLFLLPPALGFAAIYILLPKARRSKPIVGGLLAAVAMVVGAAVLVRANADAIEAILFYAFSGLAIASGVMMITQSNPVHAALSFAMVVLSTCGLFLLQAAPFLMAATIIVYAGAIVVTFLFVIMLAQQEGPSNADQRSREPFLASLAGGVLLAALLCILHRNYNTRDLDALARDLRAVANAKDDVEIKRILGDPAVKDESPVIAQLLERLPNPNVHNLKRHWGLLKVDARRNVEPLQKAAKNVLKSLDDSREQQGSLALKNVPGKKGTPGHTKHGELPAENVAAIGRTLFTDYLIPVELAATLLLVATIGAIAIAGRRSEALR